MASKDSGRFRPRQYPGVTAEPVAQLELVGEDQTRRLGKLVARRLNRGDFVGLVGDLGAGKTTLVQGLVDEIASDSRVQARSPTYALMQVYETAPRIYHMDLYRLEGFADLESIGYWDVVEAGDGICCVEWLDRIPSAWPGEGMIVELQNGNGRRTARLFGDESWSSRLKAVQSKMFDRRRRDDDGSKK